MSTHDDDNATASADELAIFIDHAGNYRILVPRAWESADGLAPEFAYLAVAAVLRMARADEPEFARSLSTWADRELRGLKDPNPKPKKKPRPN